GGFLKFIAPRARRAGELGRSAVGRAIGVMPVHCPACGAKTTHSELESGKCNVCGKSLPRAKPKPPTSAITNRTVYLRLGFGCLAATLLSALVAFRLVFVGETLPGMFLCLFTMLLPVVAVGFFIRAFKVQRWRNLGSKYEITTFYCPYCKTVLDY